MIAGDNDTDDKFSPVSTTPWTIIVGDNSTGDKFIASINGTSEQWLPVYTGEKFFAGINDTSEQLSPVTTTRR